MVPLIHVHVAGPHLQRLFLYKDHLLTCMQLLIEDDGIYFGKFDSINLPKVVRM